MKATGVLAGKAVIVTGAGTGLGRAYAQHATAEGAAVVVNDIHGDKAAETVRSIESNGGTAIASNHDVADWAAAEELVQLCQKEFGALNGLVNNAGVISIRDPDEETEDSIRQVVTVNLMGATFVGTHAIRAMRTGQGGSIVNATSSAQMGISRLGIYGATKGALASLTYGWALDLAPANIRVNAYAPQASTQMTNHSPIISVSDVPMPYENAAVVSYLLSDHAAGISGQVIQRRGPDLIVMSHPDITEYRAHADTWDSGAVLTRFDPLLRDGLQPVGDPRLR
jgi:NAD(P)-dependent dehydrogenase (short-subunit alcohol dehydrogenase family)